ncbi:hypothetical protein BT93_I0610 [Corymbia citriodora subsp. variegata]|nr:hypothetical protein BT93_I0610 [Corymbia citriodora subsp. variegata]KAF8012493.1 hypothetical protein BT93_I0610 [Corymbia citriodora subsp. variegata]
MSQVNDEGNAGRSRSQTRRPPLISLAMLRRAVGGDEFDSLDVKEVSRRVYAGVLMKDDKKQVEAEKGKDQEQPYTHKYWVDKDLNKNCWMVLAKGLQINLSHDSKCWKWHEEEEPCYLGNIKLPVAELLDICWLNIKGKLKTIVLSPRMTYEVEIHVKMRGGSKPWQGPVNLSLALPDGNKKARVTYFDKLEKEEWLPISIGMFKMMPETVGEISFSLTQADMNQSLYIKGVVFRPTNEKKPPK